MRQRLLSLTSSMVKHHFTFNWRYCFVHTHPSRNLAAVKPT